MQHLLVLLIAWLFCGVLAIPSISFPINAQVPPIARVQQPFKFVFSTNTFSGLSTENATYSLTGAPPWLSVESATRTLYGTPSSNDLGSSNFNLLVDDGSGTAKMQVTLIVSSVDSGPHTSSYDGTNILSSGAPFSGPQTLTVYPGSSVSIALNSTTFINTDETTQYYAICSDNSPLPSWLHFGPSELSFSGSAPAATSPHELPLNFQLRVIATDTPGFASASFSLQLIVDQRQLVFTSQLNEVSIISGQALSYNQLLGHLILDKTPIDPSLIANVSSDAPGWLIVDTHTLLLTGTPPEGVKSQSFQISVTDLFGDSASTTVFLASTSNGTAQRLLGQEIPIIDSTPGQVLSYTIPEGVFLVDGLTVSVDLGECSSWLQYDAGNQSFYGSVPSDWSPHTSYLNITVTKGTGSAWEDIPLVVESTTTTSPIAAPTTTSQATGTAVATGIPNPNSSSMSTGSPSKDQKTVIAIVCSVLGSLVLVTGAILIRTCRGKMCSPFPCICGCCGRRRSKSFPLHSLQRTASGENIRPGYYGSRDERIASLVSQEEMHITFPISEFDRPRSSVNHSVDTVHVQPPTPTHPPRKQRRAIPLGSALSPSFGHGASPFPALRFSRQLQTATKTGFKNKPTEIIRQHKDQDTDSSHSSWESYKNVDLTASTRKQGYKTTKSATRTGPFKQSCNFTIRPVAKSPTPSQLPSPDLSSSPRKQRDNYIHARAVAASRQTSHFFSFRGDSATDIQAASNFADPAPAHLPMAVPGHGSESEWSDDLPDAAEGGVPEPLRVQKKGSRAFP